MRKDIKNIAYELKHSMSRYHFHITKFKLVWISEKVPQDNPFTYADKIKKVKAVATLHTVFSVYKIISNDENIAP